jgi:hypothetical protein
MTDDDRSSHGFGGSMWHTGLIVLLAVGIVWSFLTDRGLLKAVLAVALGVVILGPAALAIRNALRDD